MAKKPIKTPDEIADQFLEYISTKGYRLSFYDTETWGLKFAVHDGGVQRLDHGTMEDFEHMVRSWMAQANHAQPTLPYISNLLKIIRAKVSPHFVI